MANRVLYDLAGANPDLRFSPFCWRIRMALLHKELPFASLPWRFTDQEAIAFSGQGLVPVLVDGEQVVSDSWAIADYLERTYPEAPSLFGGPSGQALTRFINEFVDGVVHPGMARLIVSDIPQVLDERDLAYFRASREKRFGKALEEITTNRDIEITVFRKSLDPLRRVLAKQPFLGGSTALYADYILFGAFQWARCTSAFELLAEEDPLFVWRERLLDAFAGHARQAPCR
ncbi:MAG: glutathione S-transferase family protein [Betaproteobacteria bacterium]